LERKDESIDETSEGSQKSSISPKISESGSFKVTKLQEEWIED